MGKQEDHLGKFTWPVISQLKNLKLYDHIMVILCGAIIMLPVLKQNLGDHKFKNEGEVGAVETIRLIME
jgi:hypothetical protein